MAGVCHTDMANLMHVREEALALVKWASKNPKSFLLFESVQIQRLDKQVSQFEKSVHLPSSSFPYIYLKKKKHFSTWLSE